MNCNLSINTGFAVNRYSEPEEWIRIVGETLGLRHAQFTADLLNPSLPDNIVDMQIERIRSACNKYQVNLNSTFTGAFTRVNHLAHPDRCVQEYWVDWFKRFVDISVALGANSMGSHFGIFTCKDNNNPQLRADRRAQNIENWHQVAKYAAKRGLSYLSWEPMSISREQGETIDACGQLHSDVNYNAPLPFKICLDVDHGDVCSSNPNDTDPYVWIKAFAKVAPLIHLKQSFANKSGHWPFTKEYNAVGIIQPKQILSALAQAGAGSTELILELSFREREPIDSRVVEVLLESVQFWQHALLDNQ